MFLISGKVGECLVLSTELIFDWKTFFFKLKKIFIKFKNLNLSKIVKKSQKIQKGKPSVILPFS